MLLKLVDRLVKEGNYAEALRILARASDEDPKNPYVRAYEARIRVLMDHPQPPPRELSESGRAHDIAPGTAQAPPAPSVLSSDQRRVALLSKVAAILSKANEYLSTGDFQRAIEEVGRARLLDAENPDIRALEERVREAREDAEKFAESERARLALEHEEAHRKEMDELRRQEELLRAQEREARRAAHEQKLNESLSRCRTLFASGRLKEARNELAFALVLDPVNQAARQLEQELTRAHEEAVRAETLRKKREEEERARAAEELRATIDTAVGQARAAASRGEFAEALDAITRAYVLDPTSTVLQTAESEITAARDEAIEREREAQRARQHEDEQRQQEALRRKAEEERQSLLQQREADAETRRKATGQEVEKHLERARGLLTHDRFEAALAEIALAFVIDPFSEPTRTLEQEILRARETVPEPSPLPEPAAPQPVDTPAGIAAHIESAREHAALRDFAKAFDSIARAYAVDPLHPAVQECEREIQTAFVEYQGSLAHTGGTRKGSETSRSASGRATFAGVTHGEAVSTSTLTFDDMSFSETSASPVGTDEPAAAGAVPAWYRHRPAIYGGGIGALILAAAVFLISSPSGKKPEQATQAPSEPAQAQQVETREPPSTPVTLSEPQIFPGDQPTEATSKKSTTPTKLRREEQAAGVITEEPAQESPRNENASEPAGGSTAETSTDPPVSLSKLEMATPSMTQQHVSAPAPGPAPKPKAPEIKRLQQPRIPDAILRSGMTGELAVLVEIDATGSPVSARVTRSTIPVLNDLFIDAVMASEFTPGVSQDGQTTTYLTIPFRVGG
jgi:outer membrane biosynthesis protein TonB